MDARQLFLMNDESTHAAGREDKLREELTEADLRICPFDRHNSIVWLL